MIRGQETFLPIMIHELLLVECQLVQYFFVLCQAALNCFLQLYELGHMQHFQLIKSSLNHFQAVLWTHDLVI